MMNHTTDARRTCENCARCEQFTFWSSAVTVWCEKYPEGLHRQHSLDPEDNLDGLKACLGWKAIEPTPEEARAEKRRMANAYAFE